jgi:hypothetical protein
MIENIDDVRARVHKIVSSALNAAFWEKPSTESVESLSALSKIVEKQIDFEFDKIK